MNAIVFILAGIGAVWVVGRVSRRSPNHPIHAVPRALRNKTVPTSTNGTWEETAQISGSLVAGDGGGEGN